MVMEGGLCEGCVPLSSGPSQYGSPPLIAVDVVLLRRVVAFSSSLPGFQSG